MATPFFSSIVAAVKAVHSAHGTGDIKDIRVYGDGRIELTVKSAGVSAVRRGRVVAKRDHAPLGKHTVYLYGRQLTVSVVGAV